MGGGVGRGVLASVCLGACVSGTLPRDPEPRSQAVGTVRVSTPLFTPLDPFREDRALDFKSLRDEEYLSDRVNQANMSVSSITSRDVALGATLERHGSQVTSATTVTSGATSEDLPALDPEPARRVAAVLESPGAKYLLAPDEVATIVAALKLYMVSLEDYYNAVAIYNDALRSNPSWVPYRVHFTVTTDPGWYTQLNGYDAVAEVSIGNPDEIQVLTVIPPQNTQAFEQFSATFRSLSASLSSQATFNKFTARAAIRALRTAAERLEGLRANTTFTASAYGGNKMRLKFRPSLVPGKAQLELQPMSRIVTAVVLVKPATTDGRTSTECPENPESRDEPGAAGDTRWFARGIRAGTTPAGKCLSSGQIEVTQGAWFEAGTSFRGGSRRPPLVSSRRRTICNSESEPALCRQVVTTTTGYLPRWTPTAVFGAVELTVQDGIFWTASPQGTMYAAVAYGLRVPAPEEGFRINVHGPGVVRCAQTWEELAERAEPEASPCKGDCASSARTSFVVFNPRASTFVCALDRQTLGDAEQVPIYVTASSNSVAIRGLGVDYSSVVTRATLRRAELRTSSSDGAPGTKDDRGVPSTRSPVSPRRPRP